MKSRIQSAICSCLVGMALLVSTPANGSLIGDTVNGCISSIRLGGCDQWNGFAREVPGILVSGDTAVVVDPGVEFFILNPGTSSTRADLSASQITLEFETFLTDSSSIRKDEVFWVFTDLDWPDSSGSIIDVVDLGGDFTILDISFTADSVSITTAETPWFSTPTLWSHSFEIVVPIPPAVWLLGSGILGLVAVARSKKAA